MKNQVKDLLLNNNCCHIVFMPGKTRCFLPSISLLTSLIFLQRKRCNLSEKNPFRKVKKDFKTFVFDVGITLNREKYQSQMLPTAWFCPLFFIWVASGNSAPRVLRKRENSPVWTFRKRQTIIAARTFHSHSTIF